MTIPVPPSHGPFEGVPMGEPLVDDIPIITDPFGDRDDRDGNKKKNKNDNDKDVAKYRRPHYEGYALERLKVPGESLSWRRCVRRWLPYPQDELVALVKKHRKVTKAKSADPDFRRLSGDKQGIINRIIDEKKLYEKPTIAEWTLVDVQLLERSLGWASKEVHKLQIVIKRTDKGNDKNVYAATGTHAYPVDDVIDLAIPLEKKKDKNKDKTKRQSRSLDQFDPLIDPFDGGVGAREMPRNDDRDQQHHHHQQGHFDQHGPTHPPPQMIPPDWHPQQPNPFDSNAQFPVDPRASFPGGARHIDDPNPFWPQSHIAPREQYEEPADNRGYIHPHHGGRARTRSAERDRDRDRDRTRDRSRSQRRRSLARRPSRDRRARDGGRRRSGSVEDIRRKVERMYADDRDSNSSQYDERSLWSRSDGRYSRSPPTSVDSDDDYPRRGADRPKRYLRDPSRPRYRAIRYRDAEYQPERTHRRGGGDGPFYPPPQEHHHRRRRDRPALHHASTYDDYPGGRAGETRYLPPAPPQRRLTDFGEKREYLDRDYAPWRGQAVDREQDAFESGVRAERRRQSAAYYP